MSRRLKRRVPTPLQRRREPTTIPTSSERNQRHDLREPLGSYSPSPFDLCDDLELHGRSFARIRSRQPHDPNVCGTFDEAPHHSASAIVLFIEFVVDDKISDPGSMSRISSTTPAIRFLLVPSRTIATKRTATIPVAVRCRNGLDNSLRRIKDLLGDPFQPLSSSCRPSVGVCWPSTAPQPRSQRAPDPRRRIRGRPRLPVRLHAGLVAAVEGPQRIGRRSRRHAVPRPAHRIAVVAYRAEPHVPTS